MVYSASFLISRLEFIPESNLSLAEFDVSYLRHLIYLILPSLGVMPRVSTPLHLSVAHIDNIIRPIAICNDTYKFAPYPYSILKEFTDYNKMVPSHHEAMKKLRV